MYKYDVTCPQTSLMSKIYKVQFVIQPHFSLLAFTAAADALTTANLVQKGMRFEFEALARTDAPVISDVGIRIAPDNSLQKAMPCTANLVVVCGGYRCATTEEPTTSKYLIDADRAGANMGGLWNGCIALAHAQLMNGYACALHPDNHAYATAAFPLMTVRPDAVVMDRSRCSSAGPNSSFELMLLLIQRIESRATTAAIRNILRADTSQPPEPEQGCDEHTAYPLPDKLQRAVQLMRNHLDEPLKSHEMAACLGMSTRAMERLFQKYLKTSPARHYMELRLMRAHELLRQSSDPVGRIADSCGFISGAHFSRAFTKRFACTPKSLQQSASQLID